MGHPQRLGPQSVSRNRHASRYTKGMLRKGRAFHLIFLLATLLIAGFLQFGDEQIFLARLQLHSDDFLAEKSRKAPVHPALVYLAIDELSTRLDAEVDIPFYLDGPHTPDDKKALEYMSRGWEWNREVYALIIEKLLAAGTRVVALDIMLLKATPNDDALRKVIEKYPDRIVIAGNLQRQETQFGGGRKFSPPSETIVPSSLRERDVIAFDNFFALVDERVRGAVFQESIDDVEQHDTTTERKKVWLSIAAAAVKKSGIPNHLPTNPGDEFKMRRLRFAGPEKTFVPHPVCEIFSPGTWSGNFQNGAFFKDKIVLLGPHGNWSQDYHSTTLGIMPGPELHLNAMNALLTGEFCRMASLPVAAICLVGAGLLSWLVGVLIPRPSVRLLSVLAIPVAWVFVALRLYDSTGYFLPTVTPILVFGLIGISGMVADQVFERMEKARVRRTLERYVSKNVVGDLLSRRDEFAVGVLKPVTILFSDVRNFTRFSAESEPHALVAQLNEYFAAMVECVFELGGTVDKFMGDAVMAVWGNATTDGVKTDAVRATRCAFSMHAALAKLNAQWKSEGRAEFEIGIALNHGNAVVGDIGSPNKMEFTVIGDAVNVAWRLQERTKDHPGEVLIGNSLVPLVSAAFYTESAGTIRVGGTIDVPYSIGREQRSQTESDRCDSYKMIPTTVAVM